MSGGQKMKKCYRAGLGALAFGVSLCLSACSPSSGERSLVEMKRVREVKGALGGVCSLNFKAGSGFFGKYSRSSGCLIDGRYVLTTAHSLVELNLAKVTGVEVVVGQADVSRRDGNLVGDGGWEISSEYLARQGLLKGTYESSSDGLIRCDYCLVDLGKRLGGGNSFRFLERAGRSVVVGDRVKVAGYPGDAKRLPGATGKHLYEAEGRITEVKGNLFGYQVETAKGMSGGPVWVEKGGQRFLVGIHVGSDLAGIGGAVALAVNESFLREWDGWVMDRSDSR